jgi:hypothetical protein
MSDYTHLIGHKFPGGRVTAHGHLGWLWADAAHAEQRPGVLHPSYALMLGYEGVGATIDQILEVVDSHGESGTVAGGARLDISHPLRPDAVYDVTAEITGMERKEGRKMGPFDRFTFAIALTDAETGELAITVTHYWMVPRKEG